MKRSFIEWAALLALLGCVNACERDAQSSERQVNTAVKNEREGGWLSLVRDFPGSQNGGKKEERDVLPPSATGAPSNQRDASTLAAPIFDDPEGQYDIAPAAPLQYTGGSGGSGGTGFGGTFGTGSTTTGGGTGGVNTGGSGGTGGTY
jgi:hypothetical protein